MTEDEKFLEEMKSPDTEPDGLVSGFHSLGEAGWYLKTKELRTYKDKTVKLIAYLEKVIKERDKYRAQRNEAIRWVAGSGTTYEERLHWMRKYGSGELSVHIGVLKRIDKVLKGLQEFVQKQHDDINKMDELDKILEETNKPVVSKSLEHPKIHKGGVGTKPTTPPPSPPKGQG